jgi:predicted TIM-barrel fold metal-dependent hydrolase
MVAFFHRQIIIGGTTKRGKIMKIIDIHTHVYPQAIAAKAAQNVRNFYQIGRNMDGTPEMLLQRGAAAGISQYIILPVAIRPDRARGINEYILSQTKQHPEFIGFGTVHAGMDHIGKEAERIAAMGLKGIKMHPDSQRFTIDDVRLYPMYEAARGRLTVMLHMGDHRYDYSHPIKLRKVLDNFPGLQVIAAHFGGYAMYETACELLSDTDCVFDVSSSLMFLPEGEAERYIGIYGAERMAFGSDYPLWDPAVEIQRFLSLKLTDDEFEQIAHKTAEDLLGI